MKKLNTSCIIALIGVVLMTTTAHAFTNNQANAYFKGVNDLGNIQRVVDANGYMSALTDANLNNIYNYYTEPIYGVTDFDRHIIFISTNQSNAYIERSVVHEYAHALARIYNLDINGTEDILYNEMPYMVGYRINPYDVRSTYCMYSKHEYFAEALVEYYKNPKMLKAYCPVTYNYMRNIDLIFNGK